jgi:anti-sigma factor RsiW
MNGRTRDMDCNELVELVTDYLEGRLEPGEIERFDAHLEECDGCATYLEQMRATISALGHLPPEALTPEVEERLLVTFRDWRSTR